MSTQAAVAIRPAQRTDSAKLANLCTQLGYLTNESEVEQRLSEMGPERCIWLALDSTTGATFGFIETVLVSHILSLKTLEIGALVVDESARCQGIGQALVRWAEDYAKSTGISKIRVRSNVTRERAHRFYERLGYEVVKTSRVFEKTV